MLGCIVVVFCCILLIPVTYPFLPVIHYTKINAKKEICSSEKEKEKGKYFISGGKKENYTSNIIYEHNPTKSYRHKYKYK